MKKIIICLIITMTITSTVNAAEVPRESAPCNATNEAILVVECFIGNVLTEVQNGLGYADARAKSNRIFFNAWLNGQTNGYNLTKEQILFWIHKFRKLNPKKLEHRRRLINSFLNSVYLFDDKIIIDCNYKDGTETITFEEIENSALGSDLTSVGAPA